MPFPMLAWLLHRRCHARCCLRPRGVGWHSSITHLPFRLRPLGKDRHDPKISVSRGYGSDSGHTPFTSLDSRISLYSGKYTTGRLTIPYPGGLVLSHSLATLNQRQVRTPNAHHNGSLPMQLEVFWSLLLQADSEGPNPHLLCSYAHFILKCARGALTPTNQKFLGL